MIGCDGWLTCRALLHPFADLSGKDEPHHAEVADERPPRMPEGGGLISFDDEVPEPGKAIADHRPKQRVPRMPQRKSCHRNSESEDGATAMQQAIARMAVRAEVEEEELVVAGELSGVHNNRLWRDSTYSAGATMCLGTDKIAT